MNLSQSTAGTLPWLALHYYGTNRRIQVNVQIISVPDVHLYARQQTYSVRNICATTTQRTLYSMIPWRPIIVTWRQSTQHITTINEHFYVYTNISVLKSSPLHSRLKTRQNFAVFSQTYALQWLAKSNMH